MSTSPSVGRAGRLPIRVRLVAGFVIAMTVLLTAAGGFVYWRVRIDLDTGLDRDLAEQSASVRSKLGADGRLVDTIDADQAPQGYQVLSATGAVIASASGIGTKPLLDPAQIARALDHPVHLQLGNLLPASSQPLRLLAAPLSDRDTPMVLVVSVRRDQRDESLRELLATLVIAGIGTLVIAAFVGDRLSKAALAPVERYRSQAHNIANGATGVRLDVPDGRNDEITRLGHTFNDVLTALEGALERERTFVNDASHELRTPLTLLSGRVQLVRRRRRSVDEHEHALAELETDIQDLIALSEQLLVLGTTQQDGHDAGVGCDLVAVVRAMGLPDAGALLDAGPESLPIAMTALHVRQIVNNLVVNAQEHGAPPITVAIRCPTPAIAALTVSDHGPGFAPDLVPVAVQRFRRGDPARTQRGSGLGLAIVDAIVQRNNGELRICSNGVHHRSTDRYDVGCEHPAEGTHVTLLVPS